MAWDHIIFELRENVEILSVLVVTSIGLLVYSRYLKNLNSKEFSNLSDLKDFIDNNIPYILNDVENINISELIKDYNFYVVVINLVKLTNISDLLVYVDRDCLPSLNFFLKEVNLCKNYEDFTKIKVSPRVLIQFLKILRINCFII